jgi:hypothetical protein
MGMDLVGSESDVIDVQDGIFVNCLWTPAYRLAARLRSHGNPQRTLIACDADASETFQRFGSVITFPTSCSSLNAACESIALQS